MAGAVNGRICRRQLGVALVLCAAAVPSWAIGPTSPFQPPRPAAARTSAGAAAAPAIEAGHLTGLRLGAAPQALIDGRWHRLGDIARGATLVAITRDGATLRYPDGRAERLGLWPARPIPVTASSP
jgi:hypothetical protein